MQPLTNQTFLQVKVVTWQKDSHSLFDYQFNKNITQAMFNFIPTHKFIFMHRNNQNSEIKFEQKNKMEYKCIDNYQYLGYFQIKLHHKKVKLEFHHASQLKQSQKENSFGGQDTIDQTQNKQQDIYLIVRSLKNKHSQSKGYKLEEGHYIKLGRVQYKVTSIKKNETQNNNTINTHSLFTKNNLITNHQKSINQEDQCKYCLEGEVELQNYFFVSPCKCIGSAGLVHFNCLKQWVQSKVKKQSSGGTIQYNFQKFLCEVCKQQFPRIIRKGQTNHQLMEVDKPKGSYLILEGVTQNSKNLIVVQNVSEDGIKIGRNHEAQIRVQDISVSRNHASIEKVGNQFYIFDSKSKFGTLVKEKHLILQISKIKQGIQIGRTVFTFSLDRRQDQSQV